jgi:hypothetical protein
MKNVEFRNVVRVASCAALFTGGLADMQAARGDDAPVSLSVGGFIRADYGSGDRYPQQNGQDQLGISKAALAINATTEDIKGVFVIGGTRLSDSTSNGSVGIKDAFIVIGAGKATGFTFSAGAQPLLFGLRPNGYPGDSSLQGNIDYGADGAFNVSQQAGPSLIGSYAFSADQSLRFGVFDPDGYGTTPGTSGSKISKNGFLLWRGANLFGSGLYATLGAEQVYVGGLVDDSKPIYSGGVGFRQGQFDVSLEYIHLDRTITNTSADEQYLRAHTSLQATSEWNVYFDYSSADKLGATDYRLGANYQFRKHLAFTAEVSKDDFNARNGSPNVQSIDARLTFTY